MTRIVVNPEIVSALQGLSDEMEFCDANGKLLGRFLPLRVTRGMPEGYIPDDISEEELHRRASEGRGRTLAEIWKRLGQA